MKLRQNSVKHEDDYRAKTFKEKREEHKKKAKKRIGLYFMLGLFAVSTLGGAIYTIMSHRDNVKTEQVKSKKLSEIETDAAKTAKSIADGTYKEPTKEDTKIKTENKDETTTSSVDSQKQAEEIINQTKTEMQATLDELNKQNQDLQVSADTLKKEKEVLQSEKNALQSEKDALQAEKDKITKEKDSIKSELDQKNKYIAELEQYVDQLEKK